MGRTGLDRMVLSWPENCIPLTRGEIPPVLAADWPGLILLLFLKEILTQKPKTDLTADYIGQITRIQ